MLEYDVIQLRAPGVDPVKMAVYRHGDQMISEKLKTDGIWDEMTTQVYLNWLRRGSVVIDVGANIGYNTMVAASIVGSPGRVYSFEPHPNNFTMLNTSIRLNSYHNIYTFQRGVANRPGTLSLYSSKTNQGAHSTLDPAIFLNSTDGHAPNPEIEHHEIELVRLDDALGSFEHFSGRVDLLKIDTEGLDISVLMSATSIIRNNADNIAILFEGWPQANAVAPTPIDCLFQFLYESDFDIWINIGDRGFTPYNTAMLAAIYSVHSDHRLHFNVLLTPKIRRMVDTQIRSNLRNLLGK